MKYRVSILPTALVMSTMFLVACSGASDSDRDLVAQGHKLFRGTCARCHGPNGEGMPRLGKDLHANAFGKGSSDQELLDFLEKGRSAADPLNERGIDMPAKGGNPTLTEEDLALIVAYLRSLE